MKNHRVLTFAGAGSALAATIAIMATLLIPTPGITVGADTIFASLRDAVSNAFTISFEDVEVEGMTANGKMIILLDPASEEETEPEDHASAVYFDVRVQTDQDAPELAGLDYEFKATFAPENMWMYVKTHALPPTIMQENAWIGMYLNMYKDGLLLDMSGIADQVRGYDWGAYAETAAGQFPENGVVVEPIGGGSWVTPDMPENVKAQIERAQEAVTEALETPPVSVGGVPMVLSTNRELNELLGRLLSGQAGPDDFTHLITLVEETAGYVTVTPQGDGTHLLRATDFNLDGAGLDAEDLALLANMALEIVYAEDVGLLWAKLDQLGDNNGIVRFERAEVAADDPMFSSQRYREDGVTKVVDLSGMLGMVKGLSRLGE